jgi:hypothetical protein
MGGLFTHSLPYLRAEAARVTDQGPDEGEPGSDSAGAAKVPQ